MKKIFLSLIILALAYCNVLADYTVSNVKVVQKFSPWGRVDISFEVKGSAPSIIDSSKLWFVVIAEDKSTGKKYESSTDSLSGDVKFSTGTHYVVWNMAKDGVRIDKSKTVFTVEIRFEAIYAIVDLSGGTSATKYPITYWNKMPSSSWSNEYKTTKLVLRRITAGKMPRTDRDITLTKDYYIGVFEVTQKQWELVMGTNHSSNWVGDTLPVEKVSYDDIRGFSNGSQWPASNAVDATSFMGKLRAKTGIDFDLPTEAQWEYACRAGSSGAYGLLADGTVGTIDQMGWYYDNSGRKTHTVGTKTPNAWGLYDMHGNVLEWCLDRWDLSSGYSGTDPVGATSGTSRVIRGGGWDYYSDDCRSTYRNNYGTKDRDDSFGLRVAAPAGL